MSLPPEVSHIIGKLDEHNRNVMIAYVEELESARVNAESQLHLEQAYRIEAQRTIQKLMDEHATAMKELAE